MPDPTTAPTAGEPHIVARGVDFCIFHSPELPNPRDLGIGLFSGTSLVTLRPTARGHQISMLGAAGTAMLAASVRPPNRESAELVPTFGPRHVVVRLPTYTLRQLHHLVDRVWSATADDGAGEWVTT